MAEKLSYERLVRIRDDRQREFDRAQGSYDATLKRICDEFQVTSIDEAKELLEKLNRREAKARKAYDDAVEQFQLKYPEIR